MSQRPEPTPREIHTGVAGASARREGERRKANRERRIRERHPRIGGAIVALSGEPVHERAWAYGAEGEFLVAEWLSKRLAEDVVLLHDRRIRGSRANIDHIAIAPSGVWVIDTKRYKGKVAVVKPLFGRAKLTIAGRDKSRLVDGLAKQVDLVEAAVDEVAPGVPVHGAICFVEAELPWFGTVVYGGFPMLHPKGLAKRLNKPGPVDQDQLAGLARELALRFPSA